MEIEQASDAHCVYVWAWQRPVLGPAMECQTHTKEEKKQCVWNQMRVGMRGWGGVGDGAKKQRKKKTVTPNLELLVVVACCDDDGECGQAKQQRC